MKDLERAIDIYLRRQRGQSFGDIAVELGISSGRVRQIQDQLERMKAYRLRQGVPEDQFVSDLRERRSQAADMARVEIKRREVDRFQRALAKAATRMTAMRRALALAEDAHTKAEAALRKAKDELAQERT